MAGGPPKLGRGHFPPRNFRERRELFPGTRLRATQIGVEAWLSDTPAMLSSQVGLEVWASTGTGTTQHELTQIGIEVWVAVDHASGVRPVLFVIT